MPEKSALTPFPVLEFPPEIRNQIWRHAVVKDGDIMIRLCGRQKSKKILAPSYLQSCDWGHQEDDEQRINTKPLALALTSRQLYLEATLMYYSENTFNFEEGWFWLDDSILEGFIAAIGPQNVSSIAVARIDPIHVQSKGIYYPINPFLSILPSLKQITINIPRSARGLTLYDSSWTSLMDACAQSHPSVVIKICEIEDLELGRQIRFVERPGNFAI